jgi:hypothetical protein
MNAITPMWWGVVGTCALVFLFKYLGHSIPDRHLEHPKMMKINVLIPIALLSALVAVQTFTDKSKLVIDHRAAGLGVALLALLLKAPFAFVVLSAALTSALLFRIG